jgi:hypothetical protein
VGLVGKPSESAKALERPSVVETLPSHSLRSWPRRGRSQGILTWLSMGHIFVGRIWSTGYVRHGLSVWRCVVADFNQRWRAAAMAAPGKRDPSQ